MKILVVKDCDGQFRCHNTRYLDLDPIIGGLREDGHEVSVTDYDALANRQALGEIEGQVIFYSGTRFTEYKLFIEDIIFTLGKRNTLLPRYEILRAHENKVYQEFFKKELGIESIPTWVFGTWTDLRGALPSLPYPVVIKQAEGSSSTGVALAHSAEQAEGIVRASHDRPSVKAATGDLIKTRLKLSGEASVEYTNRKRNKRTSRRVVIQKALDRHEGDWKVYVFGDLAYAFFRGLKGGDFRSSGSGLQDYHRMPPQHVLTFARQIYDQMQMPFASFDIWEHDGQCFMLEFQGLHFGVNGITDGVRHHRRQPDGTWTAVDGTLSVEASYLEGLRFHLGQVRST